MTRQERTIYGVFAGLCFTGMTVFAYAAVATSNPQGAALFAGVTMIAALVATVLSALTAGIKI